MKGLMLALLGMMLLAGCSKDGGHSKVFDGPVADNSDPKPTDQNFPELLPAP